MSSSVERLRRLAMRVRIRRAYQEVFDTPAGRMVFADLAAEGGLLSVAHVPGDSHSTAFNDGRASMVKHVMERLRWSEGELERLAQQRTEDTMSEIGRAADAAE